MKKLRANITMLVLGVALMAPVAAFAGNAVLVLGPDATEAQRTAAEKAKAELVARGETVVELPADEAGELRQAAILGGGGPVIAAEGAGISVYDGISGKDITKAFKTGPLVKAAEKKEAPTPAKETVPVPRKSTPREDTAGIHNRIGLQMGVSNLRKNEDDFEMLAANNAGASSRYTAATGRFRLFYERALSEKYTLGLAAGTAKGGQIVYDQGGKTLNMDVAPKSVTLYLRRDFGRHLGVYAGGGADFVSVVVADGSDLAGIGAQHGNFEGDGTVPHGEAGFILSAGNFSLRFSLVNTFGGSISPLKASGGGAKYLLTVKGNKTLSYKKEGQPLAAGERYFKADPGGFSSAVTLNYAFACW
ncbi:MAG: hypothetical protein HY952_09005 [Elusimicrobia bacterium]|nr:hypothetical protein [Elusimicrobiota bacterium]